MKKNLILFFLTIFIFSINPNEIDDLNKKLLDAASIANINQIKKLIKEGADINAQNKDGWTALFYVLFDNDSKDKRELFDYLLTSGADVRIKNNTGNTALHFAISSNRKHAIESLLKSGADINAVTYNKITPLYVACYTQNVDIVDLLIKKNADINISDKNYTTPLMISCENGNYNIVKLLIEAGADITLKNNKNQTAYNITIKNKNHRIKNLFTNYYSTWKIREKKDKNDNSNIDNNVLNEKLFKASKFKKFDVIKKMIELGADVNSSGKKGYTPLMNILYKINTKDEEEIFKYLLDAGADVNIINDSNSSALMIACKNDKYYAVQPLIDAGANIEIKDSLNYTLLHIAIRNLNEEIVKILINTNKININAQSDDGKTPLIYACTRTKNKISVPIIKMLIDENADLNIKDNNGNTALKYAKIRKLTEIVDILKNAGAKE